MGFLVFYIFTYLLHSPSIDTLALSRKKGGVWLILFSHYFLTKKISVFSYQGTLWFQLEDLFQLMVMTQGIEKVAIQLKDTPTKVYAIGAQYWLEFFGYWLEIAKYLDTLVLS